MLTEELSPKLTLEVASGLFELYLTLADIQGFWSSLPGRWVPCPDSPLPSTRPHLSLSTLCLPDPSPLLPSPPAPPRPGCPPASSRGPLGQDPRGLGGRAPGLCWLRVAESGRALSGPRCSDSRSLALAGIHAPFLPAVKLWLQVLREQARCRLQGAVDADTVSKTQARGCWAPPGLPCHPGLLPPS